MIDLQPEDFVSLPEFKRAWRFLDPKYNVLPPAALADLRPISLKRLETISAILEIASARIVTNDTQLTDINAVCESGKARDLISTALVGLPIPTDQRVIVGWDRDDILETSWWTFCSYWDDFCYPSPMTLPSIHWTEVGFFATTTGSGFHSLQSQRGSSSRQTVDVLLKPYEIIGVASSNHAWPGDNPRSFVA